METESFFELSERFENTSIERVTDQFLDNEQGEIEF